LAGAADAVGKWRSASLEQDAAAIVASSVQRVSGTEQRVTDLCAAVRRGAELK
jgi:hypothetical protein